MLAFFSLFLTLQLIIFIWGKGSFPIEPRTCQNSTVAPNVKVRAAG